MRGYDRNVRGVGGNMGVNHLSAREVCCDILTEERGRQKDSQKVTQDRTRQRSQPCIVRDCHSPPLQTEK